MHGRKNSNWGKIKNQIIPSKDTFVPGTMFSTGLNSKGAAWTPGIEINRSSRIRPTSKTLIETLTNWVFGPGGKVTSTE